jgi:hypothetical protein
LRNLNFKKMASILFTVSSALKELKVDDGSINDFTKDPNIWLNFGKRDSHTLRAKLFKLFRENKLSEEAKTIVFFFFSVIKNKDRVLSAVETLPDEIKANSSVTEAVGFIRSKLVQYTTQENNNNFAVVHLPTTMPGLDIMLNSLLLDPSNPDYALDDVLIKKATFAQLWVGSDLQATNKSHQKHFWDNVVVTSRNSARTGQNTMEKLQFHEAYYETSSKDTYKLITLDKKEVDPKDMKIGYTRQEFLDWFKNLHEDLKKLKTRTTKKKAV